VKFDQKKTHCLSMCVCANQRPLAVQPCTQRVMAISSGTTAVAAQSSPLCETQSRKPVVQ
jgi:hypothetical protein